MNTDIGPDDYPGTGDLPDALAFVKASRARAYIILERADGSVTADELMDTLECSQATAYRCLHELEDIGLVCESIRLNAEYKPKTAYTVAELETEAIRADGGQSR